MNVGDVGTVLQAIALSLSELWQQPQNFHKGLPEQMQNPEATDRILQAVDSVEGNEGSEDYDDPFVSVNDSASMKDPEGVGGLDEAVEGFDHADNDDDGDDDNGDDDNELEELEEFAMCA